MQMFTLSDLSTRIEGQVDSKVCLRRDYRGFLLGTGEAEGLENLDGQVSFRIKGDEPATSL